MVGKKLPLNDWHQQNGARFVEDGGWIVPESYGKVEMEYAALRNGTGFIDLCSEARYRVEGADAVRFLNSILTANVEKIIIRHCGVGFLCNPRGGILDQVMIYRDENYFLLFGSGSGRAATAEWLRQSRDSFNGDVVADDISTTQGQIALRGPGAPMMLERVAFGQKITLDFGGATIITIGTARTLVLRRPQGMAEGYDVITGSIYLQQLWDKFAEAARATGARPTGLAAREIYRVEAGLPRTGYEIDENTTPIELNQNEALDWGKGNFSGRRALLHSTAGEVSRRLVGLRLDANANIDRGADILFDSLPIGTITSTVISPALRCRLALGFVNSIKATPGTTVKVRSREDQVVPAEVLKPGDVVRR